MINILVICCTTSGPFLAPRPRQQCRPLMHAVHELLVVKDLLHTVRATITLPHVVHCCPVMCPCFDQMDNFEQIDCSSTGCCSEHACAWRVMCVEGDAACIKCTGRLMSAGWDGWRQSICKMIVYHKSLIDSHVMIPNVAHHRSIRVSAYLCPWTPHSLWVLPCSTRPALTFGWLMEAHKALGPDRAACPVLVLAVA